MLWVTYLDITVNQATLKMGKWENHDENMADPEGMHPLVPFALRKGKQYYYFCKLLFFPCKFSLRHYLSQVGVKFVTVWPHLS